MTDRHKKRVRASFEASAHRYHRHADYQADVAARLADRIVACAPDEPILDLGCGAGGLVDLLRKRGVRVAVALDLAHRMAARARHDTGVAVCQADADALPFIGGAFGTVASSLMLQWTPNLPACFKGIAPVLRPGGRLHAATLGPATLQEMREVMNEATTDAGLAAPTYHPFPSREAVTEALHGAGFVNVAVASSRDRWVYADPFALLRALKGVGAQNGPGLPVAGLGGRRVMHAFAQTYAKRHADPLGVVATYETIFVAATLP